MSHQFKVRQSLLIFFRVHIIKVNFATSKTVLIKVAPVEKAQLVLCAYTLEAISLINIRYHAMFVYIHI